MNEERTGKCLWQVKNKIGGVLFAAESRKSIEKYQVKQAHRNTDQPTRQIKNK